jgi:hypothetical protein
VTVLGRPRIYVGKKTGSVGITHQLSHSYTVDAVSPYIAGGLIGALSALLVWSLTTVRDHQTEKKRQHEFNRTALRAALANYLAALDSLMSEELARPPEPPLTAVERTVFSFLNRMGLDAVLIWLGLGTFFNWIDRVFRWIGYGRRPEELHDRMAQASAELRLIAPSEVLDLMQCVDDFRSKPPPHRVRNEQWTALREVLRSGFRGALDG